MQSSPALQSALENIGREFQAVTGTLHVLGSDQLLHLVAAFGVPEELAPVISTIPIGKGIAGLAAQRRAPVTLCNLQSDDSGTARPSAKLTGVEGAIAVPILANDALVGVLGIGKAEAHTYSDEEAARLLRVAGELATALG